MMKKLAAPLLVVIAGCGGHVEGTDASQDVVEDTGVDPGSDGVDVAPDGTVEYSCDNPHPDWQLCEDFEGGSGDFDAWLAASDFQGGVGSDDRGRIRLDSDVVHSGSWSVFMPAESGSGYRGASLDWMDCEGAQETNCYQDSHEQLHFRVWVRFAEDHRYVHHFLSVGGSQPDDYWYHGTAGCLPNGELHMGTTLDFRQDSHETFFYTYFPEMSCDTACDRYMDVAALCAECESKGLPTCDVVEQCCWGNHFEPTPAVALPVGEWVCIEIMMRANSPGSHDGVMAYWIDGVEAHREDGMMWRTVPELALNRVRVQHYITTDDAEGFSNRVWFDDVVVSTSRIGCE
jgi:hypothetical protein